MTTVSASSAAQLVNPPQVEPKAGAPKQRLLDRISAQAQAGSLSAADASALTSAVQDIDQAMSGASGTSGTGGARLDPAQAKSRMDDLVDAEVTKGTLTSDQATTLKSLLSSQKGGGQGGDRGGVGGAGGGCDRFDGCHLRNRRGLERQRPARGLPQAAPGHAGAEPGERLRRERRQRYAEGQPGGGVRLHGLSRFRKSGCRFCDENL